ncbi:MAG: hypothetical protein ACO3B3_10810, partial [Cyanobium sp.]
MLVDLAGACVHFDLYAHSEPCRQQSLSKESRLRSLSCTMARGSDKHFAFTAAREGLLKTVPNHSNLNLVCRPGDLRAKSLEFLQD